VIVASDRDRRCIVGRPSNNVCVVTLAYSGAEKFEMMRRLRPETGLQYLQDVSTMCMCNTRVNIFGGLRDVR
jgi:hypothetical protein